MAEWIKWSVLVGIWSYVAIQTILYIRGLQRDRDQARTRVAGLRQRAMQLRRENACLVQENGYLRETVRVQRSYLINEVGLKPPPDQRAWDHYQICLN